MAAIFRYFIGSHQTDDGVYKKDDDARLRQMAEFENTLIQGRIDRWETDRVKILAKKIFDAFDVIDINKGNYKEITDKLSQCLSQSQRLKVKFVELAAERIRNRGRYRTKVYTSVVCLRVRKW